MIALSIIFERAGPVSQSLSSPCCLSRLLGFHKEVSEEVSGLFLELSGSWSEGRMWNVPINRELPKQHGGAG